MSYGYEILSQLNKFKGKDKKRMHVPGHKNAWHFKACFPVAPIDVTELSYSDDLNCPSGVIQRAQADIAEIAGAKKAYITTDGSSSGVMCMMFAAAKYGNKIIVPRNSHKSVFNACRLMNVEPVIVQGEETDGVLTPPSPELIETLIVNDVNISGMIIATPDYYGNIAPLEEYANVLKKYGRLLFCDQAHGAHLLLNEGRAGYAGVYADMWVDGVHKGLPALTQGAVLYVNNEKLIDKAEEALSIFRTTSPSYPVMASVEYGIKYYVNNPKNLAKIHAALAEFKNELQALKIKLYPSADWSKLAVDFMPLDISPYLAQSLLEKRGIYPEMNDGRYILFYLSPAIEPGDLAELKNALISICSSRKLKGTYKELPPIPVADRTYSFLYSLRKKSEWVEISKAVGRMCAGNCGITPPCLPIIIAGELVTEQAASILKNAVKTFGVKEGKIKVVKL